MKKKCKAADCEPPKEERVSPSTNDWDLADDIEALRWELYTLHIPSHHEVWRALDLAAQAIRAQDVDKAGSFVASAAQAVGALSGTAAATGARRARGKALARMVIARWRAKKHPQTRRAFALDLIRERKKSQQHPPSIRTILRILQDYLGPDALRSGRPSSKTICRNA